MAYIDGYVGAGYVDAGGAGEGCRLVLIVLGKGRSYL